MSQRNSIFSFILDNPNLRPKEIAEALGFPAPSVRRTLFQLRSEGALSKPKADFTVETIVETLDNWKKYIVNTVMYCSSKPKTQKAETWSSQEFSNSEIQDLIVDMELEIYAESSGVCSEIAYSSGLEIQEVKKPNLDYIYPKILVNDRKKLSERDLELGRW